MARPPAASQGADVELAADAASPPANAPTIEKIRKIAEGPQHHQPTAHIVEAPRLPLGCRRESRDVRDMSLFRLTVVCLVVSLLQRYVDVEIRDSIWSVGFKLAEGCVVRDFSCVPRVRRLRLQIEGDRDHATSIRYTRSRTLARCGAGLG